MKRTERHHLKQNVVEAIAVETMHFFTTKRREATMLVAILVVIGLGAGSYWFWHTHEQDKAHGLLAAAMVVQDARVGPPAAPGAAAGLTFPTERERAQAAE